MPIYEYRCESCGARLEAIQKMSDAPLTTCSACGEAALKRLISQTSFVLKGSGWYVTDYKARPAEASASTSSSSTSTAAESKSAPPAAAAKTGS